MRRLALLVGALALGPACPAIHAQQHADWGLAAGASRDASSPSSPTARRPWLGIIVTQLETSAGDRAETAPGLSIARVAAGSPAEAAGLRAGDVLLAVDGNVMAAPESLIAAVKGKLPGTSLQVSILRDGAALPVAVILGTQPAAWEEVKRVVARVAPGDDLPSEVVDNVLLQFEGRERRPWIGLEAMDLSAGLRAYFHVPDGQGVLVSSVQARSPAAKAGLAAGDVVLQVSNRAVSSADSFASVLRALSPGHDVVLTSLRAGTRRIATVRVENRDISVWNAEVAGVDRVAGLEALAAHQRRETARVAAMLEAYSRGDSEVAATLESLDARRGDGDARGRDAELAALRSDLGTLQQRLAELEAELAQMRGGR